MTTAEEMAIAVLRGDMVAARALADHLINDMEGTSEPLIPVRKFTCDVQDLRVVLYQRRGLENVIVDMEALDKAIRDWLSGKDKTLIVRGVDRVDIYELAGGDKS